MNMYVARHVETIAKALATMSAIADMSFPPNPDGPVLMVPQRHLGTFIYFFKLFFASMLYLQDVESRYPRGLEAWYRQCPE